MQTEQAKRTISNMTAEDGFSYLMLGTSEKHRRAPNWTDGEMKALLYVWEEHHHELKMSKRNAKVYERMSKRFYQLTGEQRFKEEIKMKITNMSFQYRRLKATVGESAERPDWPYYKPIEKILSRPLENGRVTSLEYPASAAGPSTSSQSTENLVPKAEEGMVGYLPEYTGSSDEMEIKEELDSVSSDSEHTQASSFHPIPARKNHVSKHVLMKSKKLHLMQAMLKQQRRSNRAIEETCREVRRAMDQQNRIQVQGLQLQERMMNLLEKMIPPPSTMSGAQGQSGGRDTGRP